MQTNRISTKTKSVQNLHRECNELNFADARSTYKPRSCFIFYFFKRIYAVLVTVSELKPANTIDEK